jgi:hypothetical protein
MDGSCNSRTKECTSKKKTEVREVKIKRKEEEKSAQERAFPEERGRKSVSPFPSLPLLFLRPPPQPSLAAL